MRSPRWPVRLREIPPDLREVSSRAVAVLPAGRAVEPTLPRKRPIQSDIARQFRERGFMVAKGTVSGFVENNQSSIPIQMTVPDLEKATQTTGGTAVTIQFDEEAVRWLPPRQRVEIAIRLVPEDEED